MHQITDEWLERNATGGKAWTAAQFRCLGIEWPPYKGWRRALVGTIIEDEQAREFERLGVARRAKFGKQADVAPKHEREAWARYHRAGNALETWKWLHRHRWKH